MLDGIYQHTQKNEWMSENVFLLLLGTFDEFGRLSFGLSFALFLLYYSKKTENICWCIGGHVLGNLIGKCHQHLNVFHHCFLISIIQQLLLFGCNWLTSYNRTYKHTQMLQWIDLRKNANTCVMIDWQWQRRRRRRVAIKCMYVCIYVCMWVDLSCLQTIVVLINVLDWKRSTHLVANLHTSQIDIYQS